MPAAFSSLVLSKAPPIPPLGSWGGGGNLPGNLIWGQLLPLWGPPPELAVTLGHVAWATFWVDWGVDRWGECMAHPSQVQGERGTMTTKTLGRKRPGGERQAAGHTQPSQRLGFFFPCGNHDLTSTMGQAVLSAIFITYFYLLSPSQQPSDVYLIISHILEPRKAM